MYFFVLTSINFDRVKSKLLHIILLIANFSIASLLYAQQLDTLKIPPRPTMENVMKDWGPNDSLKVSGIWYGTNYYDFKVLPYTEEENIWLSKLPPHKLAKAKAEWTRLRNAVYVCYPYARIAGETINKINKQLEQVDDKSARKAIIKSKEKELKKQFADPITNLSVYQGKVLMKLINRQTGNNCYDILKEYKGSFNARVYQTIAFFFGSSLKQSYNLSNSTDHQIEIFVKEIDNVWYQNPYRQM